MSKKDIIIFVLLSSEGSPPLDFPLPPLLRRKQGGRVPPSEARHGEEIYIEQIFLINKIKN
jgi:hypothetical protein